MNSSLSLLHPYPFEKLNALFKDVTPADLPLIPLSIGEPKHPAPEFVKQAIIDNFQHLSTYPNSKGLPELRQSIANWLTQRFKLNSISAEDHILPVTGTREGIFSFVQALINREDAPYVVMPNPFYQIYEGAALLAGAKPYFINCTPENDYLGDFDAVPAEVWEKTALLFVCTPGNPTGAVLSKEQFKKLIQLSDQYNFVIASDECYSELWFDQAPVGLLEVCAEMGRDDYKNCIVFHSLSKRSNLPGMRSGFVAGDAELLKPVLGVFWEPVNNFFTFSIFFLSNPLLSFSPSSLSAVHYLPTHLFLSILRPYFCPTWALGHVLSLNVSETPLRPKKGHM